MMSGGGPAALSRAVRFFLPPSTSFSSLICCRTSLDRLGTVCPGRVSLDLTLGALTIVAAWEEAELEACCC